MYTRDEQIQIANTIIQQLGGNRFRAMTGAKNFMALESGLAFGIPGQGFAKHGINKLHFILDASDTYTVRAFRIRRSKGVPTVKTVDEQTGVYNDMLPAVFTEMTGLETHL